MTTYLQVPYAEKDQAKSLGARWDPARKAWFLPDGKDASLFSKWLSPSVQVPPGNEENPGWLRLARFFRRAPHVLLLENNCWKCNKTGYAVTLAIHLRDGEEAQIPDDLYEEIGLASDETHSCVDVDGGEVGHPLVLDQLRAYLGKTPAMRSQVATFKKRFSRTVGEAYLSQGCPHCDSIWKPNRGSVSTGASCLFQMKCEKTLPSRRCRRSFIMEVRCAPLNSKRFQGCIGRMEPRAS